MLNFKPNIEEILVDSQLAEVSLTNSHTIKSIKPSSTVLVLILAIQAKAITNVNSEYNYENLQFINTPELKD